MRALDVGFQWSEAGYLVPLLLAVAAIVVVLEPGTRGRAAVAVGLLAGICFADGPLTRLVAWWLLGFVERREDGRVPVGGRLGDAGLLLVVLFLKAEPAPWPGIAIVALAVSAIARIGAWPFRPPDAVSVLTTSIAGVLVVLSFAPEAGSKGLAAALAAVALVTALGAVIERDSGRAFVRIAAAGLVLLAALAGAGIRVVVVDLLVVQALGFGLLQAGRTCSGRTARAMAILGFATIAGVPPLAGFVPWCRTVSTLRAGAPILLLAVLGARLLIVMAVARIALRTGGTRLLPIAVAILAGFSLHVGGFGLLEEARHLGMLETIAVLAGAATGAGLAYLLTRPVAAAVPRTIERALAALDGLRDRLGDAALASARGVTRLGEAPSIVRGPVNALAAAVAAVGRHPVTSLLVVLVLALALLLLAPEIGGVLGCSPR